LLALAPHAAGQEANQTTAATAIYLRTDSDQTTIYTPRLRVSAPLAEETRVDLVYTTDIWTSASVDIRTSASLQVQQDGAPPIKKRVTEQRDEIDVGLSQGIADVTLGGSYRYSTEYDYVSHGGSLGGSWDFADNNATLALSVQAYFDVVGRAGDPAFVRDSRQLGARLSFNQVIDTQTVAGAIYELTRQDGYLASPYRYVRFAAERGPMPGTCEYPLRMCRPEQNPDERTRHAIGVYARRALGEQLSVGGSYRFYMDDWKLSSHTVDVDGAFVPADEWLVSLGYRFYRQSSATHYEPYYLVMPEPKFYTSDKELSALSSHHVGVELGHGFALDDLGSVLRVTLLGGPTFYTYDEFPLLDRINAFEITLSTGVTL
jgi:hypothetical protein